MAEYIEREPLLNHLKHRVVPMSDGEQLRKGVNLAMEILEEAVAMLPAADVAPVVHSKWEICCDGYYPYCKSCRNEPQGRVMTKYCPNCGAKMDEVGDGT